MTDQGVTKLQLQLQAFASERDWEQFHTPKNLIMALMGEVGELAEIFQWLTADQAAEVMGDAVKADHVREELADVFGYILRLADVLGVDLEKALLAKITSNDAKYPIEKSRGNAKKYTELK